MSEIPTIGDVVREWRQYWQISLTDFCQQTKLSKGYVSELEHNKIDNPKKDKLKILAKTLRITEMDIVSRRMPPKVGAAQSTLSSQQGTVVQGTQEAASSGTVLRSPLAPSDREILLRRLAVMEKRLEATETMLEAAVKNLQDAREEQRELAALAAEMLNKE